MLTTDEAHRINVLPSTLTVKQIMDSWTLQTGYPIVTVERDYKENSVEFRQHRFLYNNFPPKNETNACYFVPLSYTTASEKNFSRTQPRAWLKCDSEKHRQVNLANIASDNEWIIVNIKMSGLYKVKYEQRNYDMIIRELNGPNFRNIDTVNRALLVSDALSFAFSGYLSYETTLSLVSYLQHEDEYLPWTAGLHGLDKVDRILQKTSIYHLHTDYMRLILGSNYVKLGGISIDPTNKKPDYVKHKVLIAAWSCRFNVGDCVDTAVAWFKDWMEKKDPDTDNP